MEENNEYGNYWQDLVQRLDAEDRVADAKIKAWQMEEESRPNEETEHEERKRHGGRKAEGNRGGKRGWNNSRKDRVKKETGAEMHKKITERKEVRDVKRTKMEARKMVREGRMKTIDRYFKRDSSDIE